MENNILELLEKIKSTMSYERMSRLLSDDKACTVSAFTLRLWLKNKKEPSLSYESHLRHRIAELKKQGILK